MFIPMSVIIALIIYFSLGEQGCRAMLEFWVKFTWALLVLAARATLAMIMLPFYIIEVFWKAPLKDITTIAFGLICFITAIYLKGA